MSVRRALAVIACAAAITARGARAQDRRALTISDVLRLQELGAVVPSPDGKYVAIEVARPMGDVARVHMTSADSRPRMDIWVVRLRDGVRQQVTHGGLTGSGWFDPVWSPDGARLAMLSTDGCTCFRAWTWRLGDRAPSLIDPRNVDFWVWAGASGLEDDLQQLVWLSNTTLLVPLLPVGERSHVDLIAEAESATVAGWRAQREGTVSTASVLESHPGEMQAYVSDESIVVADVERHSTRLLATIPRDPTTSGRRGIVVSPDHRSVAVLTSRLEAPRADHHLTRGMTVYALGLVSVSGRDSLRWVADMESLGATAEDMPIPSWTSNGDGLVLEGKWQHAGRLEPGLWRIDARNGAITSIPCSVGVPDCLTPQVARAEPATGIVHDTGRLPPNYRAIGRIPHSDALIVEMRDRVVAKVEGGRLDTLLEINAWSDSIADPRKAFLRYRASDGDSLGAILVLPAALPGKADGPYPLALWVYAGFTYQDTAEVRDDRAWDSPYNLSLLTARGYAVLYPSIPLARQGSEGPVAPHLVGAVLPAIDRVGSLGIVDTSRVAVMGQSFGGWSTLALITRTNRFRSAIAMSAVSDQVSYAGVFRSWDRPWPYAHLVMAPPKMVEAGQQSLEGSFWQYPERYIEDSPVMQSNRVETPTMIIEGDQDFEGMQQSEEFFNALYRLGKRAEFVRYFGDTHAIESPANVRDMWQRIFEWLSATLSTPSKERGRAAPN